MIKNWSEKYNFWLNSSLVEHDVEEIDKEVQVFFKDSYSLHKKINNLVSETLKEKINDFKMIMPNVLDLGNPNIKGRHWEKILTKIGMVYYEDMPLTLAELFRHNVVDHKDFIQDISASASGEAQLEQSLEKIRTGWTKIKFIVARS
jgi:dynein heavy chain, axonemal